MPPADPDAVIRRELAYHDDIYSGSAQEHFAEPGTRALRARMVSRMRTVLALGPSSRVLSLGCGIGDTELRLAPFVGEVVGIDLSPRGIDQARADAERLGIRNARFEVGSIDADLGRFDAVVAVFLLHHLPDEHLATLADHVAGALPATRMLLLTRPQSSSCQRLGRPQGRPREDGAVPDGGRTRTRPRAPSPRCSRPRDGTPGSSGSTSAPPRWPAWCRLGRGRITPLSASTPCCDAYPACAFSAATSKWWLDTRTSGPGWPCSRAALKSG